jgi:hypothetical protein
LAGCVGLGLEDLNFDSVSSLGIFAHGKWIDGSSGGRVDSSAGEQAANHHCFGSCASNMNDHSFLIIFVVLHDEPVPPYYCCTSFCTFILIELGAPGQMIDSDTLEPTQDQIDDESRRMRRLRILVYLALDTIASGSLSPEEAAGMAAATRKLALDMFPGKEKAFDLLYRPKFQRVMHEVYRLQ